MINDLKKISTPGLVSFLQKLFGIIRVDYESDNMK